MESHIFDYSVQIFHRMMPTTWYSHNENNNQNDQKSVEHYTIFCDDHNISNHIEYTQDIISLRVQAFDVRSSFYDCFYLSKNSIFYLQLFLVGKTKLQALRNFSDIGGYQCFEEQSMAREGTTYAHICNNLSTVAVATPSSSTWCATGGGRGVEGGFSDGHDFVQWPWNLINSNYEIMTLWLFVYFVAELLCDNYSGKYFNFRLDSIPWLGRGLA